MSHQPVSAELTSELVEEELHTLDLTSDDVLIIREALWVTADRLLERISVDHIAHVFKPSDIQGVRDKIGSLLEKIKHDLNMHYISKMRS